eukprot:5919893-Alexandrium_andersonii.AAC.1
MSSESRARSAGVFCGNNSRGLWIVIAGATQCPPPPLPLTRRSGAAGAGRCRRRRDAWRRPLP